MMVIFYGEEFEIPDVLIDKYINDFSGLPGSRHRDSVMELRGSTEDVLDHIAEDPEVLREPEYLSDFIKALAMRQALQELGVLYDA